MRPYAWTALLLLGITLAGCTGPADPWICEQKTQSGYTSIPPCKSANHCFSKTGFDESLLDELPLLTQDQIHQYRTHVAYAWHAHHQANAALSEIRESCRRAEQIETAQRLNAYAGHLQTAAAHAQKAHETLMGALATEEAALIEDGAPDAVGEPLFDAYARITQDLNPHPTQTLGLRRENAQHALEQIASQNGLYGYTQQVPLSQLAGKLSQKAVTKVRTQATTALLLTDLARDLIDKVRRDAANNQSIQTLEGLTPADAARVLDAFIGARHSVHEAFVQSMHEDAKARKEARAKAAQAIAETGETLARTRTRTAENEKALAPFSGMNAREINELALGIDAEALARAGHQNTTPDALIRKEKETQARLERALDEIRAEPALGKRLHQAAALLEKTRAFETQTSEGTPARALEITQACIEKAVREQRKPTGKTAAAHARTYLEKGDAEDCARMLDAQIRQKETRALLEKTRKERDKAQNACLAQIQELAAQLDQADARDAANAVLAQSRTQDAYATCLQLRDALKKRARDHPAWKQTAEAHRELHGQIEALDTLDAYDPACRTKTLITELRQTHARIAKLLEDPAKTIAAEKTITNTLQRAHEDIKDRMEKCLPAAMVRKKTYRVWAEDPKATRAQAIQGHACYYAPVEYAGTVWVENQRIEDVTQGWDNCVTYSKWDAAARVKQTRTQKETENEKRTAYTITLTVETHPGITLAIVSTPVPQNATEIRAFLGAQLLTARKEGKMLAIEIKNPTHTPLEIEIYYTVNTENPAENEKEIPPFEPPKNKVPDPKILRDLNRLVERARQIGIDSPAYLEFIRTGTLDEKRIRAEIERKAREKTDAFLNKIQAWRKDVTDAGQDAQNLLNLLENADQNALLAAGYYLDPRTLQDLHKMIETLQGMEGTRLAGQIEKAQKYAKSGEYLAAAGESEKAQKTLLRRMQETAQIREKTGAIADRISQDAKKAIAKAKERKPTREEAETFAQMVTRAQKALDEDQPLKAIQYAKTASAMAGAPAAEQSTPALPAATIPLVAVIAATLVWKRTKTKQEKKRKAREQKIRRIAEEKAREPPD